MSQIPSIRVVKRLTVIMTLMFVSLAYRYLKLMHRIEEIEIRNFYIASESQISKSQSNINTNMFPEMKNKNNVEGVSVHEYNAVNILSKKKSDEYFDKTWPLYAMPGVDCKGILTDTWGVMEAAMLDARSPRWLGSRLKHFDYIQLTQDCRKFKTSRGYVTSSLSSLEEHFPLAYGLVVYRDIEQVERLLRAVYRPHNAYCLHVDLNAGEGFFQAVTAVASCFPNVHLAPRLKVTWGTFSVLEVELLCMELLVNRSSTWKYYINLTGQEFPLKTNRELVEILKSYQGANDIDGKRKKDTTKYYTPFLPAPFNVSPSKGSLHMSVSRAFVHYVLTDARARRLLDWVRPQHVPDETFFSTLNHNPQLAAPGGFPGLDELEKIVDYKPWYSRYKSWAPKPCAGIRLRGICILSTGDLPLLHKSKKFFANKFLLPRDRLAYGCLEQRLFNRTRDLQLGLAKVDVKEYAEAVFVQFRLGADGAL